MYLGKSGDCIGGLVGGFHSNLGMQNSYNTGNINSNNIGNPEIGNIIGRTNQEYSNNNYYLKLSIQTKARFKEINNLNKYIEKIKQLYYVIGL